MQRRRILGGLLLCVMVGCEPLADELDFEREAVPVFRSQTRHTTATRDPSQLRVMAYNVKFGAARIDFWFDYYGDRVQMSETEVLSNLAGLERLIDEVDPDILLAEEVDVNARRSAYVDMLQHVLDHSALQYGAFFESWTSRYVPSEGLGRIQMGNAIFSKYPIRFAERIRQIDRTDLDPLTQKFYVRRALGRAVIDLGGRDVAAYVVHTEAYDQDGTKQKQIRATFDEVRGEPLPALLGGDFNELPPVAVRLSDFDDELAETVGTEFEQPPYTPEVMRPFFEQMTPALSLDDYGPSEETQRRYFSHTVRGPVHGGFWNRTLDYLFVTRGGWEPGKSDVLQSPGRQGIQSDPLWLSDHAPVVGTWVLP